MIKKKKKTVSLSQVSLGLRGDTIGVLRPKGSSFITVPSLLELQRAWLLVTRHSLSAEGSVEKSVPWQQPLERT